ncbi:glycosyltransferase family 2 protein [Clostridium sp. AN503]|uniref:tetratricopeptide repeat-containing glycosyltransferase family 2 protein n=1 Tax=Clostridium sp. AN503 TaxID=3160598 RepID=UPI00345A14A5
MITISLCMIVKNEEPVIARILEQMKDIADEMIIVDTGSVDQTKEIAKKYTDQVFEYPWKQDFAAARNFACSKSTMDYWMWLDADDVLPEPEQKKLLRLKEELDPDTDVVMMKYQTGFDQSGNVSFSYYRERLLKNGRGFYWEGKVHEAVTPRGKILYSPISIEHRKLGSGDPDRNLNIYENMLENGERLGARHLFYYARELYYHQKYEKAVEVFGAFLEDRDGWVENKIEACIQMASCFEHMEKENERLKALFASFVFDIPRAEVCCEIGRAMMDRKDYRQAVFWYQQALLKEAHEDSGAFIQWDCYGYLPAIQLCVCYDRMGDFEKALEYHKKSMEYKPDSPEVKWNKTYFAKRSAHLEEPDVR